MLDRSIHAHSTGGSHGFQYGRQSGPLAEINVTPLVDVMLVLLIIFIVTAPMLARPITVDLPQRSEQARSRMEPPAPIGLRVDASGQVFWNASPIMLQELQPRLIEQMRQAAGNQPELRIAASADVEYAVMAKVLAG